MSCGGENYRDVAHVSLRPALALAPGFYGNYPRQDKGELFEAVRTHIPPILLLS